MRAKKVEGGATTYYLRSTVLGGQSVAELDGSGNWVRGYVYLGGQMVAIQANSSANWVHQDPVTKSQYVTNSSGTVTSTVDLDPWGGETSRSSNAAFQPHRFTTYTRDADGGDDAMMRRYGNYWARFSQPDPYDGSYNSTDPQSFNRYAYTQNDPVNFVDPAGLDRFDDGLGPPPPPPTLVYPNGGTIVTNTSAPFWPWGGGGGGGGGGGRHDPLLDTGNEGGRGGRGGGGGTGTEPQHPVKNPCPPTGAQLANDPKVVKAVNQAWRDSRPGARAGVRREQGGWIYARNGQLIIRRATSGGTGEINLLYPPQVRGALLVANFHTHPGFASQGYNIGPSSQDVNLENHRGVPGLVVVEGMLIKPYGPNRRGSNPADALDPSNPENDIVGYPGNTAKSQGCP